MSTREAKLEPSINSINRSLIIIDYFWLRNNNQSIENNRLSENNRSI